MFDQIQPEKTEENAAVINKGSGHSTDELIKKMINSDCFVTVTIPVRNEAETIKETLKSLAGQVDFDDQPVNPKSFEIIVLANNCNDDSAKISRKFQHENPHLEIHTAEITLPKENANIGFVRRLLMDEAFRRLRKNRFGGGVIMTTDGDTIVADNWISANLREIEAGADAVGGRIIIPETELAKMDALCREIHLKDEEYRLLTAEIESLIDDLPFDNAPRHHQHFNGSFAVKTDIYEKAGGIPEVKFLEDCAFFDSLQRIDARVRHSPDVKVFTSARRAGRSEVGLSFQLNQWKKLSETGEDFLVESAESIVERFRAKKKLRKIQREFSETKSIYQQEISTVAAQIFVDSETVLNELEKQ